MIKEIKFINGSAKVAIHDEKEPIQATWMHGNFYEAQRNGLLGWIYHNLQGIRIAVDVGACIGNHTLFLIKEMGCKKVFAVEANRASFDHMLENIALSKCKAKAECFNIAAWNRTGQGITKPGQTIGMTEFEPVGYEGDDPFISEVACYMLDNILQSKKKVDYMKIDIEGAEIPALQGAHHILADDRPVVSVETHDFETVAELLKQYGYRPEMNGKNPLVLNHTPTYIFWPE